MNYWTTPLGARVPMIHVPAWLSPADLLDALFHATIYSDRTDYSRFWRIDAERLEQLAAKIRETQGDAEKQSHG